MVWNRSMELDRCLINKYLYNCDPLTLLSKVFVPRLAICYKSKHMYSEL